MKKLRNSLEGLERHLQVVIALLLRQLGELHQTRVLSLIVVSNLEHSRDGHGELSGTRHKQCASVGGKWRPSAISSTQGTAQGHCLGFPGPGEVKGQGSAVGWHPLHSLLPKPVHVLAPTGLCHARPSPNAHTRLAPLLPAFAHISLSP